jgi:hypothetical protein
MPLDLTLSVQTFKNKAEFKYGAYMSFYINLAVIKITCR